MHWFHVVHCMQKTGHSFTPPFRHGSVTAGFGAYFAKLSLKSAKLRKNRKMKELISHQRNTANIKTFDLSGFSVTKQEPELKTATEKWTSKKATCISIVTCPCNSNFHITKFWLTCFRFLKNFTMISLVYSEL